MFWSETLRCTAYKQRVGKPVRHRVDFLKPKTRLVFGSKLSSTKTFHYLYRFFFRQQFFSDLVEILPKLSQAFDKLFLK